MGGLFDPIFGSSPVADVIDDQAWLRALCTVEAALARAGVTAGVMSRDAAVSIGAACDKFGGSDPAHLGVAAAADGNPVIPLVKALRALVPDFAADVHRGATSQDIFDTAMMLISRDALLVLLEQLSIVADCCVQLAAEHRDTAMVGRTLLQQAVPTTFGVIAAGWGEGVDRASRGLRTVQADLAVQLGGAAGTLAGWHPHGAVLRAALAAELGLKDPGTVWHTERARIAELAAALGIAAGVIGKIATDIVLLAQSELGEVHEGAGGGSSAMPHKQNPIAAVTARAAAAQAPGLVATLLAAMPAELQRGAGPWHAEWPALMSLLRHSAGAATRLATSLAGLHVDRAAMTRNLDTHVNGGSGTGHAGDLVDNYLKGHRR